MRNSTEEFEQTAERRSSLHWTPHRLRSRRRPTSDELFPRTNSRRPARGPIVSRLRLAIALPRTTSVTLHEACSPTRAISIGRGENALVVEIGPLPFHVRPDARHFPFGEPVALSYPRNCDAHRAQLITDSRVRKSIRSTPTAFSGNKVIETNESLVYGATFPRLIARFNSSRARRPAKESEIAPAESTSVISLKNRPDQRKLTVSLRSRVKLSVTPGVSTYRSRTGRLPPRFARLPAESRVNEPRAQVPKTSRTKKPMTYWLIADGAGSRGCPI